MECDNSSTNSAQGLLMLSRISSPIDTKSQPVTNNSPSSNSNLQNMSLGKFITHNIIRHANSVKHVEPVKFVNTVKPVNPVKPVNLVKPVSPIKSVEDLDELVGSDYRFIDEIKTTSLDKDDYSNSSASEEDCDSEEDGDFTPNKTRDMSWVTKRSKSRIKRKFLSLIKQDDHPDINPILLKKWFTVYNELEPNEKSWVYQQVVNFELKNPEKDKIEIEECFENLTIQDIYKAMNITRPRCLPAKLGALNRSERLLRKVVSNLSTNKRANTKASNHEDYESTDSEPDLNKVTRTVKNYEPESKSSSNPSYDHESKSNSDQVFVNTIKCLDPTKPKIIILSRTQISDSDIIGYYLID